jgi:hypothetical protein
MSPARTLSTTNNSCLAARLCRFILKRAGLSDWVAACTWGNSHWFAGDVFGARCSGEELAADRYRRVFGMCTAPLHIISTCTCTCTCRTGCRWNKYMYYSCLPVKYPSFSLWILECKLLVSSQKLFLLNLIIFRSRWYNFQVKKRKT